MNIGKEEEAIDLPIPVDPASVPVEQPIPVEQPAQEPAHARILVGANSPLCGYCGDNDHTEANCPYKPRTK